MPAGRLPKIAQPLAPVVPLNDPAPLPLRPTPATPWFWPFWTETASAPAVSLIEPFGGATRLCTSAGGRLPMLGQLTVEVIRM